MEDDFSASQKPPAKWSAWVDENYDTYDKSKFGGDNVYSFAQKEINFEK